MTQLERIERVMGLVAEAITTHDLQVALPLFERLEKMRAEELRRADIMSRVTAHATISRPGNKTGNKMGNIDGAN